MHAWEQIQQTVDFIEEHLEEEIKIDSLAKMAALSPFYFQRLFRRLVKRPVAEYTKLRRMARATEYLLQKDKRILDIALELGFLSHEHFSRIFKETFGMTPNEYRKNPQTLNHMTRPELLLHYTMIDEGVPLITSGIVLEINRRKLTQPICFTGLEKKMPVQFVNGLGTESGVDPLNTLWQDFPCFTVYNCFMGILKSMPFFRGILFSLFTLERSGIASAILLCQCILHVPKVLPTVVSSQRYYFSASGTICLALLGSFL